MLLQKFWKKRVMVIGAMVFILALFTLNLNALVKGKVEVNEAGAWKFWIFHAEKAFKQPDGSVICRDNGFSCFWIDLGHGEQVQLVL